MKSFIEFLEEEQAIADAMLMDILFEEHTWKNLQEADLVQPWANVKGKTPQEIYQIAMGFVKDLVNGFDRSLKKIVGNMGKVLVNVKGEDRFITKAAGGKGFGGIHDLLRSAILLKRPEDVDVVVKQIKKKFKVVEYDHKADPSSNEYGYFGSHHFKIMFDKVIVEIQVMTQKLWTYKGVAHDIYGKYRTATEYDKENYKKDLALSRHLFRVGNS